MNTKVSMTILIKYKCLPCNNNYSHKIDEELKKQFTNKFKFSNNDINIFISLWSKGVYPYEYIVEWDKFNETMLPTTVSMTILIE